MKTADLYIRVSTDEQADKGYSQRDQEERLRRYCSQYNFKVGNVIYEDHSAKTFNRPAWNSLLQNLKKNKGKTHLVLFTKWDRFSRNAGDAYQMINMLTKLGVNPQAIEQPLDLTIPENKMMLAIYLAAPEVENDRRALNTFYGMRRAKKEGRVMGNAPFGYANKSKEDGKKYIALIPEQSKAMKWAFTELAKGILSANQIRLEMNRMNAGKLSSTAFHVAIRNPIYCGKIFIPKYKDEEAYFVTGLHEALISEALFDKVQMVLDGNVRKERPNTKILSDENLPLRGFLVCPKCNRNLTGSASTGRNNRYYYYHCLASCGFRQKAGVANKIFENGLKQLHINKVVQNFTKKLLIDSYNQVFGNPLSQKKSILENIDKVNNKLSIARNKLLEGTLEDDDYLAIKKECKIEIEKLEKQLIEEEGNKKIDIKSMLDRALDKVVNLGVLYAEGGIQTKREIIGSIFPEKLEFDGKIYRTTRINTLVKCIFQINNELAENKNRIYENFLDISCVVAKTGVEPVTSGL
ncbi:recombinase family protein [Myroides marinus]|uniref:recombinase family protein n=1 Tax=Myroides marinus TaxID=703342 RepID=UPI002575401D|nr:recombinase family protein [Myroides marinus]MDM1379900.1 recombinase family protein [Myroides marinus]MDM1387151.1 recombinase family protein [Myroides marinus]MDM1394364.1 recombinase family protein [Myroides marinus]